MAILGFGLVAAAVLLVLAIGTETNRKSRLAACIGATILAGLGLYLIKLAPYVAGVGSILLCLSCYRRINQPASASMRQLGGLLVASSLLAIIAGLFASPWDDATREEDRSDWQPAPIVATTPAELLDRVWSTSDEHADWPVARLMLELCKIAYDDPVDARGKLTAIGFESETINSGSMNGYVLSIEDHAIVILRGTESSAYDVIQDLRFLKRTNDNGSMHGGFVNGYDGMHGQVQKLLQRFGVKKVWITGHSLGGALSIVCASRLLEDGEYKIAGVMTFGQPKVVRDDTRRFLEPKLRGKYVFFVNDMDPVARVIDPYTHFGHMVRRADNKIIRSEARQQSVFGSKLGTGAVMEEYTEPMSDDQLDNLLNQLEGQAEPVRDQDGNPVVQGYFPNVSDHRLDSYSNMLDLLIDNE